MIVSLEAAKRHLVVDFNDDDQVIGVCLSAACDVCQQYLGRQYSDVEIGSEGAPDVPPAVVAAILMLTASLYEKRAEQTFDVPPMSLPSTVRMLLAPYRLLYVEPEITSEAT